MTGSLQRLAYLVLLFTLLLCSGCVTSQKHVAPGGPQVESGDKAERVWRRYVARATTADALTGPFRISASLRYTEPSGDSTRVSSLFWGNGQKASPYPLRLDLTAGIGTVVAKIREDATSFVAYSPDEKTAYTSDRGDRTLVSFGVPIPFTLGDLSLLLTGHGSSLLLPSVPTTDSGVPPVNRPTQDGVAYTLAGTKLAGILELSSDGVPLSWRESGGGWAISFEPGEANPLQPHRLRIAHPQGHSALIVVRDMSRVSPPFSVGQLDLPLPPGTAVKALEP